MLKTVFIVKQYQPEENYMGHPCAVFDTYEEAQKEARDLNVRYGKNIVLDEDGNFCEICEDAYEEDYHYYEVEEFTLNRSCTRAEGESPSVCCIIKHEDSEECFTTLSEGLENFDDYGVNSTIYLKHEDNSIEVIKEK